jgi:hypothetical protein
MTTSEGETAESLHDVLKPSQLLPFTISVVKTASDLSEAVSLRSAAYLRHNAPAADKLRVAEDDDRREDVILLVARSKLDGGVVGTIRINPNFAFPLQLERAVTLPIRFRQARCVEFMRLGVSSGGAGRLVTASLAKAAFYICAAHQVDFIFVASRPPVDVVYRTYRFDDLLEGQKVELPYAPGIGHSILCLPVREAEARWQYSSRGVYRFFVETHHPDLRVDHAEIATRFARASSGASTEVAL